MRNLLIAFGLAAALAAGLPGTPVLAADGEPTNLVGIIAHVDLEYHRVVIDDHVIEVPASVASLEGVKPGTIVTVEFEKSGSRDVATFFEVN